MDSQKLLSTDENYKSILAYERKTAQIVTSMVLDKPELSVWMILIPIVLIPFLQRYQKYKESAKAFSAGLLYTKKIALDIAYKAYKNEITMEDVCPLIKKTVQKKNDAVPKVLNIYQKQIQEIKILFEHYYALLTTGKFKYGEMIVCHYQNKANFLNFVDKLMEAEKEVTKASSAIFQEEVGEVPEIMAKLENCLYEFRIEEAEIFFRPGSDT